MLPQVIRNPLCAFVNGNPVLKHSWSSKKKNNKKNHSNVSSQVCLPVQSSFSLQSHCGETSLEIKPKTEICSWVSVNKQLPRFAAGLGGARLPGVVGVIPAGTSGYYNPPGTAAMNCASAAAPEVCWSGCSEGCCCCPRQREMAGSCRPWSRWHWGCAPREPRRFCTASWTWISGSGTRSWPTNQRISINCYVKMFVILVYSKSV